MSKDIWERKPFSINDLVCDEHGNSVETEMDSWLVEVKAYIESLERRLAEAEEEIKSLWVQRRIDSDHRAMYCQMKNEAESRLRAASELPKKWREIKFDVEGFKTIRVSPDSAILQCADELVAALKGEAEEECISKTLMKECGCYPKSKEVK